MPTLTKTDWRLVAPWYRWELRGSADPERTAEAGRPVFHKYVTTDFMEDFLKDPQRSVRFDDKDLVQRAVARKPEDLFADGKRKWISGTTLEPHPSRIRKLFLPAHQRYYLVAIELHCDEPGFPRVHQDHIAEVGFVIRRRRVDVPDDLAAEAARLVRAAKVEQSKLGISAARERARLLHPFRGEAHGKLASGATATVAAARRAELASRELRTWARTNGIEQTTEGWAPSGEGSMGAWVAMPDEPEGLVERHYPMRRLTPDPDDPDHAAREGTIFYALAPMGGDEVTDRGASRFNELDTYEIRAYVRRVDEGGCPGELVWSEASEPFRIASFFDPDGCAQRPTEVRLPDFSALEASDAPPSVRMSAPGQSTLLFSRNGQIPKKGKVQGFAQICFFSIPLITIIAFFVLNIFLPVVMFVFQLWWMLKLKFCIPPSIEVEGEISAALDVEPPALQLMAGIDVNVLPGTDPADLIDALKGAFDSPADADLDPVPADYQVGSRLVGGGSPPFTGNALFHVAVRNGYGRSADAAPFFSHGVLYRPHIARSEVVHP